MKKKRLIAILIICIIALNVGLTGCASIKGKLSNASSNPSTSSPSVDNNKVIDYSQYIKKAWIVKSWNKGAYDGYSSFCIYKIANGEIEGKFYTNAIAQFDDQENSVTFTGTANNDKFECQFSDKSGNSGNVTLVFKKSDETEATIKYTSKSKFNKDKSLDGTFLFRPYNLNDIDGFSSFKDQCFTVDLNSWGNVNFVSGKVIGGNRIPTVAYLTSKDGDILYSFNSLLPNNVNVKAVSFQDVNKDELKDIIIILNEENGSSWHMARIMFQKADGSFHYDDKLSQEVNDSGNNKDIKAVTDYLSNISQNVKSVIYTNSKLGFSLTFPETWKGKYTITEKEKGITVFQKFSNKTAMIFEVSTELESKWKDWTKTPEDEAALPVKKIGAKNGLVFVYHENEQPPYMNINDEEKKETEEYNKMVKDIKGIISSFKTIE